MPSATIERIDIPIVIIGGGCCGLTLSSILSDYDVEHILFERHPGTSYLPKAHYLNQRTMEIFRQHGIADAIYKEGSPLRNMCQVLWQTSLGGSGPHDRRIIASLPSYGGLPGSPMYETYQRDSPSLSCNLPLIRSEPILRRIAEERNHGNVLFSHNVTDVVDTGDHVLVTVRTPEEKLVEYRAQYVVGADGGKTVGPKIGVKMEGLTHLEDKVSVHFRADLSEYWDGRTLIDHFINPEGGTITYSGALVPMGPTWGRHCEEWTINFGHKLDDPQRFNEDSLVPRLRGLLNLPDLKLEVLHISHWIQERVLASKYQQGRLFIAGDAAHRHPPTTGLGMNTAVADAHNLAWKLALVVKGQARPFLLHTYEAERRPSGRRNCDWAAFTAANRAVLNSAIGLVPGQIEANRARFDALFEDSESGRTARAQVQQIIKSQKIEFSAHDLELGFRYDEGAIVGDGTTPPPTDPLGQTYHPTTRPGHRLPHAWVHKDGIELSTHDLVGRQGAFCLITDGKGDPWISAVESLAAKGIKINTARIEPDLHGQSHDYEDSVYRWRDLCQIEVGGAVLVRPDNFVAWRSKHCSSSHGKELLEAIESILGRTESFDSLVAGRG